MKLGIQLYSLCREMDKSFEKTLEAVARIGYEGVEFAGYYGKTPKEVKQICKDLGLEISSAHIGLPKPEEQQAVVDFAAEAGIPALITAYLPADAWFPRYNFNRTMAQIEEFDAKLRAANIKYGFHNHYLEFAKYVDDKNAMQLLRDNTKDDFILEVDTCWAQYGYGNAFEAIKDLGYKATKICHFKTLKAVEDPEMTTFDKGCVDFKPIADYLKANNADWAIVEQEQVPSVGDLEAAKINHDFIRTIL